MGGVLMVCTANQIRSPLAQRMMVAGLTRRFGPLAETVVVLSAGLRVGGPMPMHPLARRELERRGIPGGGHTSTPVDAGTVERASLVLTATREQRDEVLSLAPSALPHTFTLRELARLLAGLEPGDIPGRHLAIRVTRVPEVARPRRGVVTTDTPAADDIDDPLGGTEDDYARAAAEIEAAITSFLAVL